jgi:hypothetical protein
MKRTGLIPVVRQTKATTPYNIGRQANTTETTDGNMPTGIDYAPKDIIK